MIAIASLVWNSPSRIRNSPTKFADPGIASVASATIRNSAASTGARNASPPIFVMSSVPDRSASSTMIRNSGATTSPWLTICSSAPCAPRPSGSRAKIPSTMKPSWAIDE